MKPLAIFLVILVIAAIVGIGWFYFNSNLEVTFSSCIATDPLTQADVFSQVKASIENDTFVGTLFNAVPPGSPEDCIFYTWTVHLDNRSFLPINVIEIQITPMSGDILVIGDAKEHTLDPRSETDLSVTMLTSRDKHSVREAIVTWYVWGFPFSTRLTLG